MNTLGTNTSVPDSRSNCKTQKNGSTAGTTGSAFGQDDSSSDQQSSSGYFIGPLTNPELSVQTRYVSKDVEDPMAVHGSCGLYNLGNTCFMNAGIQCLASCAPLLKYFFEQFQLMDTFRNTLTGAFYLLLCKMWSGRYSIIQPRHFKELLGLYHPQFQDYRQHDCQEFLALLLDTLHEQLNQITRDSSLPPLSSQPSATSTDVQAHSHLNNEDLIEPASSPGNATDMFPVQASSSMEVGSELLCPETLSSEEELVGSNCLEDVSPKLSQGQTLLLPEIITGKNFLKRASSSPADVLISEDSNHSTVSGHSTDSEQSSAFKKLKIDSDSSNPGLVLTSVSESCDQECSVPDSLEASPALTSRRKSSTFENNSDETKVDSVGMSPPSNSNIPHKKLVRLDIPSQSQVDLSCASEGITKQDVLSLEDSDLSGSEVERKSHRAASSKFNNTESALPTSESPENSVITSSVQNSLQNDLPTVMLHPQDGSQTNPLHFYCKETKTLNTNVLVSNYVQGDVAIDSEKFAKVDNRSQIPAAKEVNLLQEALHGMEEDKVEKALICKSLASGSATNINSSSSAGGDEKIHHSSNLRTVKIRNHSSILRKPTTDPNLLNNSYDYEDEVLIGYSGLVCTALGKGTESGSSKLECVKPSLETVVRVTEKMELVTDMVSSEVEKNVQMQALSKLKATITKSNIREDISDKASTSESTETEDGDMEVEVESSASEDEEEEPPLHGSIVGDNPSLLPNAARCFNAADIAAANAAWECYKARNNSVVVDTFQGQFKSTVVCSECDHVSVTYEPFMYLSLPIPYAMERQICVVFVRPHKSTMRYMITLHKNEKVQKLRRELQSMTSTENSDVILAEVLDNHVSRLLEDNIMLRYVNDTSRTIHAFQMLPPPEMPLEESSTDYCSADHTISINRGVSVTISQPLTVDVSGDCGNSLPEHPSSSVLSVDRVKVILNSHRENLRPRSLAVSGITVLNNQLKISKSEELETSGDVDTNSSQSKCDLEDEFGHLQPPAVDPMLMGTGMWEWNSKDEFLVDPPPQVSAPPSSPTSDHSGIFASELHLNGDYSTDAMFAQSPSSMDVEMDHIASSSDFASVPMWPEGDEIEERPWGGEAGDRTSGLMDQWQTCAICLEELIDSQLLTHKSCSGVFCHTCLQLSAKHSGDLANCCPICLCPVDVSQDFVPLASSPTVKSKVRILAIPITFRHGPRNQNKAGRELQLVCGPRLTYVASQQDASALYALVDRVVPFAATYSLHFTDGQGIGCSRCEYTAHCTGCEVAKEGQIIFQPGDNLTVHFTETLATEEVEAKMHVSDDASLQDLRSSEPISIFNCFEAFTQSEVLDEHNPWYCPCCCRNQCAKKTMTVWRYPDNLIIHLKRFVYEDLSSTKIDNRVVFPHTNLDVTRFLAGPNMSFNVYDLYSIVCHYGGANSGHYTAFTCHPLTREWYNYNDETVTQQRPGEGEFDSSYLLFFKRQGPAIEFDLVKYLPHCEEQEELNNIAPSSSMALVPYHSAPPAEQTSTAHITFETEGFSIVSDGACASQVDTTQNYDFYN